MIKQNLGKLDRIFRFLLAFWWLGPFAPQFGLIWLSWVISAIGGIALLESFVGYCWLHDWLGLHNKNQ